MLSSCIMGSVGCSNLELDPYVEYLSLCCIDLYRSFSSFFCWCPNFMEVQYKIAGVLLKYIT